MATPESCTPKINQTCIAQGAPKRNNYFSGKYISAEDLTLEQEYFINKIKQMNSELSGYGIINGLTISGFNNTDENIVINPGIGIDSCGNVLAIYNETKFTLPDKLNDGDYIYLRFLEKGKNRVARKNDEECGDECCVNHIVEEMEIYVDETLLTLESNDICTESKEMKIHHKLEYLEKASVPFLLLGRYKYVRKKGIINNSDRIMLHTNAELSKLLCHIEHNHVRSLNGEHGDLKAISTINNLESDITGALEIVAGNNISVTSEEHKITIATRNGFHNEYEFLLNKDDKHIIAHNRNAFPSVDVYKRVEEKAYNVVYEYNELAAKARDMQLTPIEYFDFVGAKYLTEFIDTLVVPKGDSNKKRSAVYSNSKMRTKNVLDKFDIKEYSSKVVKVLDKEIRYNISDLMVVQNYNYEKIVGGSTDIKIKVTHLDNRRVEVKNISMKASKGNDHFLVIINT